VLKTLLGSLTVFHDVKPVKHAGITLFWQFSDYDQV